MSRHSDRCAAWPQGRRSAPRLAWVDSRPTWDDAGVRAFAVLLTSAFLGLLEPARPWLWAAAIGLWFPLLAVLLHGNYGAFLALALACLGAHGGSFLRRLSAIS